MLCIFSSVNDIGPNRGKPFKMWWVKKNKTNTAEGKTKEAPHLWRASLVWLMKTNWLSYSILFSFFFYFFSTPVLEQLPFMMMSHPLIPASLAPASVSMAMGQMNRQSMLASMANVAHLHANPPARAPTSVIKVNSEAHQPGGSDHEPVIAWVRVMLREEIRV